MDNYYHIIFTLLQLYFFLISIAITLMIMIIFIRKKDTLQIMATNKQQSPNLRMPVESCKKLIWLIIN